MWTKTEFLVCAESSTRIEFLSLQIAGKENIPNLNRLSEKPKSEKLKRQRSNIPEAQEVEAASSPDNEMSRRKSLEETNPVTSHFRDAM